MFFYLLNILRGDLFELRIALFAYDLLIKSSLICERGCSVLLGNRYNVITVPDGLIYYAISTENNINTAQTTGAMHTGRLVCYGT